MASFLKKRVFIYSILFVAFLVIIIAFQYMSGTSYIDSDMSAQMIYAKQLNEEHSMVSENWYYSTEISIISECHIYRITMALFPNNWHAARVLAKAIALLLLAAAFLYMAHGAGFGEESILGAIALIAPFGYWQTYHLVFDPSYTTSAFYMSLIYGGILHLEKSNRKKIPHIIAIITGSLVSGLMGPRILLVAIAPIILAGLVVYYIKLRETKKLFLLDSAELHIVLWALVAAVVNFFGFVINTIYLSKKYSFADSSQYWKQFSIIDIFDSMADFLSDFGFAGTFYGPIEVMSINGLVTGGLGLMFAGLIIFMFCRLISRIISLDTSKRLIVITSIIAIIICSIFFRLTDGIGGGNGGYYITLVGIIIISAMIEISTEEYTFKYSKKCVVIFLLACIFMLSVIHSRLFVNNAYRHPNGIEGVTAYLEENEIYQGYATFWNGPIMTEISDGKIEVWTIDEANENGLKLTKWFQTKDHFEEKPLGKVFLLVSSEEEYKPVLSIKGIEDKLVYEDGYDNKVFVFDDISDMEKYIPKVM